MYECMNDCLPKPMNERFVNVAVNNLTIALLPFACSISYI